MKSAKGKQTARAAGRKSSALKTSAAKSRAAKPSATKASATKVGTTRSGAKDRRAKDRQRSATKTAVKTKPAKSMKMATRKQAAAASSPKPRVDALRSPLLEIVLRALDDMKAVNVITLDVRGLTDVADAMVIASGNSDRHVRSIADRAVEVAKQAGYRPMGIEGERDGEWVLVDLQDVILHVMLPRVREFYRLESLWDVTAARREAASDA